MMIILTLSALIGPVVSVTSAITFTGSDVLSGRVRREDITKQAATGRSNSG